MAAIVNDSNLRGFFPQEVLLAIGAPSKWRTAIAQKCRRCGKRLRRGKTVRNLNQLEQYRQRGPTVLEYYGWEGDAAHGAFVVPSCIDRAPLVVVASGSGDWDHVSVSRRNRCPSWPEMEQIKKIFFEDGETVMQLHVPIEDHVNAHPTCLHLWRPQAAEIPRPPSVMVGLGDRPIRDRAEATAIRKKMFGRE